MMQLIKNRVFYIVFALLMFVMPVYASEEAPAKTKAELIQEAILNGDQEPQMDTAEEITNGNTEGTTKAEQTHEATAEDETDIETDSGEGKDVGNSASDGSEEVTADSLLEDVDAPTVSGSVEGALPLDEIEARIKKLDPEKPSKEEVTALRTAYDLLSMADKVNLPNYADLKAAEALIAAEEAKNNPKPAEEPEEGEEQESLPNNNQKAVSPPKVNGNEFVFEISEYTTKISVVIHFTTDDNNDGRMDTPKLTLVSPIGQEIALDSFTKEIKTDEMDVFGTWEDSYAQYDMAKLPYGKWVIRSDIPATFDLAEYRGPSEEIKPNPEDEQSGEEENPVQVNNRTSGILRLALVMFLFVGGFIGFMVWSRIYFSDDKSSKPSGGLLKKFNGADVIKNKLHTKQKTVKDESENDEIHPMTEEEEMEMIRREFEEEKKMMAIQAEEAKEEREMEEESDELTMEDDRMDVSRADYDEEEFDDFVDHFGDTDVLTEKEDSKTITRKKHQFGSRFS